MPLWASLPRFQTRQKPGTLTACSAMPTAIKRTLLYISSEYIESLHLCYCSLPPPGEGSLLQLSRETAEVSSNRNQNQVSWGILEVTLDGSWDFAYSLTVRTCLFPCAPPFSWGMGLKLRSPGWANGWAGEGREVISLGLCALTFM